ncbi:OLC1v1005441C1 [Oldenlandia corymbosa var. corymbosa]|uniref:OLC1v1005441C1 n=1 Tax=Oldenlandia corymbosa var. corymbosa TaxID=529605 RepID=A0AAV1DEK4_OLDCO|nr:OLC1v1005441C1 [Oldenlandia corymbosa var. corymbosa]
MDEKKKLQVQISISDIKIVKRSASGAKVKRFEKPSSGDIPSVIDIPHRTTIEVVIFKDTNGDVGMVQIVMLPHVVLGTTPCPLYASQFIRDIFLKEIRHGRMIQIDLMICGIDAFKEPETIVVSSDGSWGRVKKYWAIGSGDAVAMEIWKKAYSSNGVIHKSIAYENARNTSCFCGRGNWWSYFK